MSLARSLTDVSIKAKMNFPVAPEERSSADVPQRHFCKHVAPRRHSSKQQANRLLKFRGDAFCTTGRLWPDVPDVPHRRATVIQNPLRTSHERKRPPTGHGH